MYNKQYKNDWWIFIWNNKNYKMDLQIGLKKISLIPDEDEWSHFVVYANVSQMLSQWIMIKMTLKGGGGFHWWLSFIFKINAILDQILNYNIKSTRYNIITNSSNKLSGRSLLIKIADT